MIESLITHSKNYTLIDRYRVQPNFSPVVARQFGLMSPFSLHPFIGLWPE